MSGDRARAVADAVLYEGYLLYPYRSTSSKNQSRWQFGVLGPDGAADAGLGEESSMSAQCLVAASDDTVVALAVRFLQLQHRGVQNELYADVPELTIGDRSWVAWDEAVECELVFGPMPLANTSENMHVPSGFDVEELGGAGRLVRTRESLDGVLEFIAERDGAYTRLTLTLRNTGAPASSKQDAIARSFIGAHIIADVEAGEFVSLLEPPVDASGAVGRCAQHRCFPVLAGPTGDASLLLISPIILYDHPEIAEQSEGALFDSTEIDEILTLRVMTMTDEEKAQARATDPRAAEIIDRCDAMTPESMQRLHGVLRDPHLSEARLVPEIPDGIDWWDPLADNAVAPESDAVLVAGVRVSKGTRVRLHPARRADAQDLFFDGRIARVTTVHEDVDGQAHVGVVIEDGADVAALPESYGRFLYFAPDEVEPITSPQ